jgi:hypothetical protein
MGYPGVRAGTDVNAINQDDERKVFSKEEATTCSP